MKALKRSDVFAQLADRPYPDLLPTLKLGTARGRSRSSAPTEAIEGERLHRQLLALGILHTHVANERIDGRSYRGAIRQGMREGWPDFMIMGKKGQCLFIELKRVRWASWSVSDAQMSCISDIRERGHVAEICWGSDHAIALVLAWLAKYKTKSKGEGQWAKEF